ncbi:Ima1 N-terminal domain-containing protein [Mycena floridula]|nr:Ima1 N-terminal domain-containing protein [Mycena floridula]
MSLFKRRQNTVACHFCHSIHTSSSSVAHPNFRCSSCGCWNRYDSHGEILSDEPAMHDENLNARSFGKRASPSKDRLPAVFSKSPFCSSCQRNQMLFINLLSNYLPETQSPDYQQRLEQLPAYKESLHQRYPQVCQDCLPLVEEEIRNKDTMVRSRALGGWLKETKGKDRQRRVSGTLKERDKMSTQIIAWRLRGFLWVLTWLGSIIGSLAGAFHHDISSRLGILQPYLPMIVLLSTFWNFWDPTYATVRNAEIQGRNVRLQGKKQYLLLQAAAWILRLVKSTLLTLQWFSPEWDYIPVSSVATIVYYTSILILELVILVCSCFVLHVQRPPTIRLLDSTARDLQLPSAAQSSSRASTPMPSEPDLFASLSLSSNPLFTSNTAAPPVFGLPSLKGAVPPVPPPDESEMDWSPTEPISQPEPAESWLRPQRFFHPAIDRPTGLEDLFQRTALTEDVAMTDLSVESPKPPSNTPFWVLVAAVTFIPIIAVALRFWATGR